MHFQLHEDEITCPCCWESIPILVDPSEVANLHRRLLRLLPPYPHTDPD